MNTSRNGTSCMLFKPVNTIRATHSVIMSRLVISTLVGYQYFSASVCSGQPSVLCGQRAEENQVSRTSSSCLIRNHRFALNAALVAPLKPGTSVMNGRTGSPSLIDDSVAVEVLNLVKASIAAIARSEPTQTRIS